MSILTKKFITYGINKKKIVTASLLLIAVTVCIILFAMNSKHAIAAVPQSTSLVPSLQNETPTIDSIVARPKETNESEEISSNSVPNVTTTATKVSASAVAGQTSVYQQQTQQIKQAYEIHKLQSQYAALSSKTLSAVNATSNDNATSNGTGSATNAADGSGVSNNSSSDGVGTGVLAANVQAPKSPYTFFAGGVIPAVMISGLNSELSGEVIAQVRENVYDSVDGKFLLIPQGSKLIGVYNNGISFGQDRVGVAWNRLIYPNGYSLNLKGQPGTDIAGFSGFYDQVDNHYLQIFGSSFIIGVITAGMEYSQNSNSTSLNNGSGFGSTLSASLGQQMGQTGLMIAQKNINVAPTIIIRQGYTMNIMTTADLILMPYKQD
jgi:type IV secretion system protein TrbI